jgi:hypothetical protein
MNETFIEARMPQETATVTAESSNSEILASLTPEQTKHWRVTGQLPEAKPKEEKPATEATTEAASSTAAKEASGAAPAAETSTASVTVKEEHKPKGAEARIKELLADNKRLNAELESARKAPTVAPAKVEEVAKPHRNDVDAKTGQPMYASDAAFEEAQEKYLTAKITADVEKRQAKAQSDARIADQNKIIQQRWQNSLKIANENHADFKEKLKIDDKGKFNNPVLQSIKTNGTLDAWILDSDIGAELLYYFSDKQDEVDRIQSLNPFAAARELTRLEEKLTGTAAPPPKEEEKPDERSSPNVSKAPAPAASIAGKGTAPVDEEEAAVKSEDFKRYQRVANAEDAKKYKKAS